MIVYPTNNVSGGDNWGRALRHLPAHQGHRPQAASCDEFLETHARAYQRMELACGNLHILPMLVVTRKHGHRYCVFDIRERLSRILQDAVNIRVVRFVG